MRSTITDVAERHIGQIAELEIQCFSCPWTAAQLRPQLKNEHHEFIAAVDENDVVLGYVGMMYVLDEGYISNVAVAPTARRQGVADALISALTELAHALALSFVTLEVRQSNDAAIRLYEKHGFTEVGRRKNYYERPKEDALLMTYYL